MPAMAQKYPIVGITARSDIPEREASLTRVTSILEKAGVKVLIDGKRCAIPELKRYGRFKAIRELDLLVVLGGDGTILRVVREMDDLSVPILSVNRGTIGFLSEMDIDEVDELLPRFLAGKGHIEKRSLLHVKAMRGKTALWEGHVLNEAVISQGAISRLIDLKTTVNGNPLATFHADGVIIATPTGSTAYSLAAGGPIVHPELRATILTPINPHSFSQKPIVLPADDSVDVTIHMKQNKFSDLQVSLTLDGQTYVTLKRDDVVHTCIADDTIKFLRRSEENFFTTLRTKLKWGERLEDE